MKIAVTATEPSLDAAVDPRFGRCACFLVVETNDLSFEAIENPNAALGGGAGIQSAQLIAEKGAKHVLTGNCGPNAYRGLSAAGVSVIVGCSGRVKDVVEQFKAGSLSAAEEPNVASHFGMGGAGMGMGRGMGMGGGRGMGRGGSMEASSGSGSQPLASPQTSGREEELSALEQQAKAMTEQVQQVEERIRELEEEGEAGGAARVDPDKCTGCGMCVDVCPVGAIEVQNDLAVIDADICTQCLTCVEECPNGAISMPG